MLLLASCSRTNPFFTAVIQLSTLPQTIRRGLRWLSFEQSPKVKREGSKEEMFQTKTLNHYLLVLGWSNALLNFWGCPDIFVQSEVRRTQRFLSVKPEIGSLQNDERKEWVEKKKKTCWCRVLVKCGVSLWFTTVLREKSLIDCKNQKKALIGCEVPRGNYLRVWTAWSPSSGIEPSLNVVRISLSKYSNYWPMVNFARLARSMHRLWMWRWSSSGVRELWGNSNPWLYFHQWNGRQS